MQSAGIYKLEFTDGSYYIGQSVNLKSREKNHYDMLLNGNHHSYKVQNKYNTLQKLPVFKILKYCETQVLNIEEDKLIDIQDFKCLNIKPGGDSNFGINAVTAKYLTEDLENVFFLLVDNPGIPHKEVAEFTGVDINTVHDISAGRSRAFTELKNKYPEKYAKLISQKAHNTRGKNTVVLENIDGRKVTLVTGEYSEFCRNTGVQSSNLSKVISGKRESTLGWKLVEKYENV